MEIEEDTAGDGTGARDGTDTSGITRGEAITASTAVGAGVGAHVAIQAGVATGAAAVPIYAGAASGIGGAAVLGWGLGTLIGEIPVIHDTLDWISKVFAFGQNLPTGPLDPMRPFLTPPTYPDLNYIINYGESSTPQEMWWYVPEDGDMLAEVEIIGVSGGSGAYFLTGDASVV